MQQTPSSATTTRGHVFERAPPPSASRSRGSSVRRSRTRPGSIIGAPRGPNGRPRRSGSSAHQLQDGIQEGATLRDRWQSFSVGAALCRGAHHAAAYRPDGVVVVLPGEYLGSREGFGCRSERAVPLTVGGPLPRGVKASALVAVAALCSVHLRERVGPVLVYVEHVASRLANAH